MAGDAPIGTWPFDPEGHCLGARDNAIRRGVRPPDPDARAGWDDTRAEVVRWKENGREVYCEHARFSTTHDMIEHAKRGAEMLAQRSPYANPRDAAAAVAAHGRAATLGSEVTDQDVARFQVMRQKVEAPVREAIVRQGYSAKRRRRIADQGAELDMGRLMSGEPEHWIQRHRNVRHRSLRIFMNSSMIAGDNEFGEIAAGVAAFADVLESEGFAVEIIGGRFAESMTPTKEGASDMVAVTWPVKAFSVPLDVRSILAWGRSHTLSTFAWNAGDIATLGRKKGGQANPSGFTKAALAAFGFDANFGQSARLRDEEHTGLVAQGPVVARIFGEVKNTAARADGVVRRARKKRRRRSR